MLYNERMFEERLQSVMMRFLNGRYLNVRPLPPGHISLPPAQAAAQIGPPAQAGSTIQTKPAAQAQAAAHAGPAAQQTAQTRTPTQPVTQTRPPVQAATQAQAVAQIGPPAQAGSTIQTKPAAQAQAAQKPQPKTYMLYAHVPFCERLCPYCSFNRFPFDEPLARAYFAALRDEMRMVAALGYDFASMYIGGGTPTVLPNELATTINLARELFNLREVSCETNPNHLAPPWLDALSGRVQRLSVGAQSFSDALLRQMDRLDTYGTGMGILARLQELRGAFDSLNVDMILNFPSQTEEMLLFDLAALLESGCNQATFYPLMASPVVRQSLARSIGQVSYRREERYYELISEVLTRSGPPTIAPRPNEAHGSHAPNSFAPGPFEHGSAWTFNATRTSGAKPALIDEYIVDFEEYPAIGSGGFSYLGGALYVNTFSVPDYIRRIGEGRMSVVSRRHFSRRDRMRYRFMMQLFGLRLDKRQWRRDFGCSVPAGVPAEYAFFKSAGAFATDDKTEITLTPKGRYLLVALMRQFFIGVNGVRDEARRQLPPEERELLFG